MAEPSANLALVPVGAGRREPPELDLTPALAWLTRVSHGRYRPALETLPAVHLPSSFDRYRGAGGMGPPPRNSQSLVADVLTALDTPARQRLANAGGRLALAVGAPFRPHAWHLAGGGHALGGGVWCRRYAVLPARSPLGTLAHELAHLLLGWPDLAWEPSLGEDCLMARGAARTGGLDPAPPCAPLLVAAGWRDALPLERGVPVAGLAGSAVGTLSWQGREMTVEHRNSDAGPRLLLYRPGPTGQPRLVGRVPLAPGDGERSVLGIVAPALRRLVTA